MLKKGDYAKIKRVILDNSNSIPLTAFQGTLKVLEGEPVQIVKVLKTMPSLVGPYRVRFLNPAWKKFNNTLWGEEELKKISKKEACMHEL